MSLLWIQKLKTKHTLGVGLVGFCFLMAWLQSGGTGGKVPAVDSGGVDTYIPEGFVLLPIELSNGITLAGLLKDKGVVDLYTADPTNFQAQRAASAVKIIRSPVGQLQFAALLPENQAGAMIQRFQSFYAVIQNPDKKGTKVMLKGKKKKRLITIEPFETP